MVVFFGFSLGCFFEGIVSIIFIGFRVIIIVVEKMYYVF